MKRLSFLILTLAIIMSLNAMAGDFANKRISYPKDDIDLLVANIDLAAGKFNLRSERIDDIIQADVEYDDRQVEIYSDYSRKGRTGYLEIGSDLLTKTHVETEDNRWEIALSKAYKTELSVDIGVCDARFDLGGIPLTYLNVDVGAAGGSVIFGEPNPEVMEDIIIDAGASKFEIEKLGNANFEMLSFEGGVGKFILDFSGQYRIKSRAEISVGLGKAIIHIPGDLPVRVEAEENFLSSIEFKNADDFDVEGGYFESRDFRNSDIGLNLRIDVGLGSAEIIWD
jgi:hypothetical protein